MNLHDPGTLRSFLGRHGISAAKGLGQHFLVSAGVVDRIVAALEGCSGLLEIGPGPGVLTQPLSERAERMIALEVDDRMIAALRDSAPRAEVRKQDALEADLAAVLQELPAPRAVVSNLPYYITGPLLTRIAEAKTHYGKAVLMMQKEVGERVMAPAKSSARGSLSVYLQSQFSIRRVAVAPAGAFYPPPKVDSVVLELVPDPSILSGADQASFFRLVRVGFTQPRKTLVNNLLGLGIDRERALDAIRAVDATDTVRPQELQVVQWLRLSELLR